MSTRLELLKRYLKEDPDDSFLQYALALEFIALNDHTKAYMELERLLLNDPGYLPAYYMAGKSCEVLTQFEKAKEWYSKGIELARMKKDMHTMGELSGALENLE
jgi:tetratricopeptide (TPR) repeat protein